MKEGNFELQVIGSRETEEEDVVYLDHGQVYSLALISRHTAHFEVILKVSGQALGLYDLPPGQTVHVKEGEHGLLRFFRQDSLEAKSRGRLFMHTTGWVMALFAPALRTAGEVDSYPRLADDADPALYNLDDSVCLEVLMECEPGAIAPFAERISLKTDLTETGATVQEAMEEVDLPQAIWLLQEQPERQTGAFSPPTQTAPMVNLTGQPTSPSPPLPEVAPQRSSAASLGSRLRRGLLYALKVVGVIILGLILAALILWGYVEVGERMEAPSRANTAQPPDPHMEFPAPVGTSLAPSPSASPHLPRFGTTDEQYAFARSVATSWERYPALSDSKSTLRSASQAEVYAMIARDDPLLTDSDVPLIVVARVARRLGIPEAHPEPSPSPSTSPSL